MSTIPSTRGNPQASDIAVESALSVAGTVSRTDLQSVLTTNDSLFQNLFEDRNAKFVGGGSISLNAAGTTLTFSDRLDFVYNNAGTQETVTSIVAAAGTLSFSSNGNVAYISLTKGAPGSATLTSNASSLPAASTTQEVFLLALRRDDLSPSAARVYFGSGSGGSVAAGSATTLGGGGGGLTNSYQATGFTAANNNNYLCNTTSAGFTATLPNGSSGATIQFVDDASTWGTNNLTIAPASGQTIQGISGNGSLVCNLSGAYVQLSWDNTNSYWTVASSGFQFGPVATPSLQGIVSSYVPAVQSAIKSLSSAGYTILTTDGFSLVTVSTGASDQTVNLPAASANTGRLLTFKKTDTGTGKVIIARAGSDTIDGATSYNLLIQYHSVTLYCDGTTWSVVAVQRTPTQQIFTSGSGTYTTPVGATWLRVRMVGGGAGGGGSGTAGGGSAAAGGNTTFGSSFLTANGGGGGVFGGAPGAGGTATIGAGASGFSSQGASGGGSGAQTASGTVGICGGDGASTPLGGGGGGITQQTAATSAGPGANSGAGGGGAGTGGTGSNNQTGSGGSAGGYIDAIIPSPAATYSYAVGSASTGGTAGTNGQAGANGSAGIIIVEEHYS